MIKQDIIERVAQQLNFSAYDVRLVLDAAIEICKQTLNDGEEITLRNFGTFHIQVRAPKLVRNINTREEYYMPARRAIKFTPGKDLKID